MLPVAPQPLVVYVRGIWLAAVVVERLRTRATSQGWNPYLVRRIGDDSDGDTAHIIADVVVSTAAWGGGGIRMVGDDFRCVVVMTREDLFGRSDHGVVVSGPVDVDRAEWQTIGRGRERLDTQDEDNESMQEITMGGSIDV